jgi:hypothetical protein
MKPWAKEPLSLLQEAMGDSDMLIRMAVPGDGACWLHICWLYFRWLHF